MLHSYFSKGHGVNEPVVTQTKGNIFVSSCPGSCENASQGFKEKLNKNYKQNDLHTACRLRRPLRIIRKIVCARPGVLKEVDEELKTPLHVAAESGSSKKVIDYLLKEYEEAGMMQDKNGKNPLHLFCETARAVDVVHKIVSACPGAVEQVDHFNQTPLHIAATRRLNSIIHYLLVSYTDAASIRDINYQTPIHNFFCGLHAHEDIDTYDPHPFLLNDQERCEMLGVVQSICDAAPLSLLISDVWGKRPIDYADTRGVGVMVTHEIKESLKTAYIERRKKRRGSSVWTRRSVASFR